MFSGASPIQVDEVWRIPDRGSKTVHPALDIPAESITMTTGKKRTGNERYLRHCVQRRDCRRLRWCQCAGARVESIEDRCQKNSGAVFRQTNRAEKNHGQGRGREIWQGPEKLGADVKIKVIKAQQAAPAAPKLDPPTFEKAQAPVFQAADDAPAFQAAEPATPPPKAAPKPKTSPAATPKVAVEPTPEAPVAEIDTSGITVAPNEGDLFEAEPEPEAPDLDLSEYAVLENDGSLLVEPGEEVVVELDLSAFSVKENDGTPLVEASADEVPRVEAPDFGLDEPGAILDTIKEEKELLNPNTMGITMAMPGEDLIPEDEKPPAPPPVAPDTSKINLVPNFDT